MGSDCLVLALVYTWSFQGCVHTWCPSTGAWTPAQNSVAFRRWVLQRHMYHLVPKYKVQTWYSGTMLNFWWEYLEKSCVHISAQ